MTGVQTCALPISWRALETALPLMDDGRKAKFLFLPEKEDPDSFVQIGRASCRERV